MDGVGKGSVFFNLDFLPVLRIGSFLHVAVLCNAHGLYAALTVADGERDLYDFCSPRVIGLYRYVRDLRGFRVDMIHCETGLRLVSCNVNRASRVFSVHGRNVVVDIAIQIEVCFVAFRIYDIYSLDLTIVVNGNFNIVSICVPGALRNNRSDFGCLSVNE